MTDLARRDEDSLKKHLRILNLPEGLSHNLGREVGNVKQTTVEHELPQLVVLSGSQPGEDYLNLTRGGMINKVQPGQLDGRCSQDIRGDFSHSLSVKVEGLDSDVRTFTDSAKDGLQLARLSTQDHAVLRLGDGLGEEGGISVGGNAVKADLQGLHLPLTDILEDRLHHELGPVNNQNHRNHSGPPASSEVVFLVRIPADGDPETDSLPGLSGVD